MTSRPLLPGLVLLSALALGACASQSSDFTASVAPPPAVAVPAVADGTVAPIPVAETVTRLPAPGAYRLTAEEAGLNCKKLTGRMVVRIMQIRDFQERTQATGLARSLQTAAKPMFGGSGEGTDPEGRYARDRAMLEAYNQRLIEMKCPSFDLAAELAPGAKDVPRARPVKKP